MEKHSLIRTIYLYLFSLVGLTLLIIGSVRFVDMGLKAFVFTKAEEEQSLYSRQPAPMPIERIKEVEDLKDNQELSEEEKILIKEWLEDYQQWQEKNEKIDLVVVRRHRDASINLSLILIGLPLFLYHWKVARKIK